MGTQHVELSCVVINGINENFCLDLAFLCCLRITDRQLCHISANINGKTYRKSLVSVERVSSFWSFLESLLEELGACENFLSSQPLPGPCPKCQRHRLPSISPLSAPPSHGECCWTGTLLA